jgi:hypothetical protein
MLHFALFAMGKYEANIYKPEGCLNFRGIKKNCFGNFALGTQNPYAKNYVDPLKGWGNIKKKLIFCTMFFVIFLQTVMTEYTIFVLCFL